MPERAGSAGRALLALRYDPGMSTTPQAWFDAHLDLAYLQAAGRNIFVAPAQAAGPDLPGAATLRSLPLFYAVRGLTYLGWVHTRQETETARELTPTLVGLACEAAEGYLSARGGRGPGTVPAA